MKTQLRNLFRLALLLIYPFTTANAETINVTVSGISFQPTVVAIQSGDTIQWTGMGGHSTVLVEKLSPSGAMQWDSPIGRDFEHTFTEEGIYIYNCKPHANLGMAGAVIVGKPTNIDALRKLANNHNFESVINEAIESAETSLNNYQ